MADVPYSEARPSCAGTTTSESPPLVEELRPAPQTAEVLVRLAQLPHVVFFDSALRDPLLGRYSFLAADPYKFRTYGAADGDPLADIAAQLASQTTSTIANLPPFQGGAAGLLGYELGSLYEKVLPARFDEFEVPQAAIGYYDVVVCWDHAQDRAWIISHGAPEPDPAQRRQRAATRLAEFAKLLNQPTDISAQNTARAASPLSLTDLAPQTAVGPLAGLTSNFEQDEYLAAVQRAIEYIRAGDIFQVNLSQRLLHPAVDSSLELYLRLRARNRATFAGYFDLGDFQIASASPERFVRARNSLVETRPIKGTRRRSHRPEADLFAGDDLLASDKDRAENVMIVDLLRNDLSRVCLPDSVRVEQLCQLETYEFVQHLVSAVEGRLRPGLSATDLVRVAFPGGSVTGAPKIRARQIIAELEPTVRGPYCGSLGYFGFDGGMDSSILIRTVTAGRGWWQAPVGGGIVAQSQPRLEYEETWHKAEGVLRAFNH